jgi:hypothetical protein
MIRFTVAAGIKGSRALLERGFQRLGIRHISVATRPLSDDLAASERDPECKYK